MRVRPGRHELRAGRAKAAPTIHADTTAKLELRVARTGDITARVRYSRPISIERSARSWRAFVPDGSWRAKLFDAVAALGDTAARVQELAIELPKGARKATVKLRLADWGSVPKPRLGIPPVRWERLPGNTLIGEIDASKTVLRDLLQSSRSLLDGQVSGRVKARLDGGLQLVARLSGDAKGQAGRQGSRPLGTAAIQIRKGNEPLLELEAKANPKLLDVLTPFLP